MLTRDESIEYGVIDNKWLLIGGFTLLHFLATMACVVISFGFGMSRFDTGGAETLLERVTSVGADILMFPIYQIFQLFHLFGMRLEILPVVANSLFWAVCFYWVLRIIIRRWVRARS